MGENIGEMGENRMEGLPFVPDRMRLLYGQVWGLKSRVMGILKLIVNQGT